VIAVTVSAALLLAKRVITVSRVLRSCKSSSGRLRLLPLGDASIACRSMNDQISLPMTRLGSLIRGLGSLGNIRLISAWQVMRASPRKGDLVLRSARPAATGRLAPDQIPPELFGLLCRPENESIDRLESIRPV